MFWWEQPKCRLSSVPCACNSKFLLYKLLVLYIRLSMDQVWSNRIKFIQLVNVIKKISWWNTYADIKRGFIFFYEHNAVFKRICRKSSQKLYLFVVDFFLKKKKKKKNNLYFFIFLELYKMYSISGFFFSVIFL